MKDTRFAKLVVLINCAVPASLLAYDASRGQLGANPVNFAIRTTGMLTLLFLSLSLVVTPVRKLTGHHWLIAFRRTLGLYAFFYGLSHFTLFYVFDRSMSIAGTISEMVTRPYLTVGSVGLIVMAPLAVTSTNAMIKRLGAKRWQTLHRLAYIAAISGVVHYYMLVKADVRLPIAFAVTIGILLGYRLVMFVLHLFSAHPAELSGKALDHSITTPIVHRPRFWSGELRVVRIFDETPDVRTFRLQHSRIGSLPFDYIPGQYLNLTLEIDGKRVHRSYTISSSPTRSGSGCCEITVKRDSVGTASRHLHDHIQEGDLLKVSAPSGSFTFTGAEADRIVLLGAGVGITPLMSVIRALTDRGWAGDIYLIHCVRTESDAIFREELSALSRRFPNLHATLTLTRPSEGWTGPRGRISPELLSRVVPRVTTSLIHVCGPSDMMDATLAMLRSLGVPEERIRTEAFTRVQTSGVRGEGAVDLPSLIPSPALIEERPSAVGQSPVVHFSISGKTVTPRPDQSVLEAAEDSGVPIPFSCRSGICGACRTKRISGTVCMEVRDGLSPEDERRGLILACQARPLGFLSVEA